MPPPSEQMDDAVRLCAEALGDAVRSVDDETRTICLRTRHGVSVAVSVDGQLLLLRAYDLISKERTELRVPPPALADALRALYYGHSQHIARHAGFVFLDAFFSAAELPAVKRDIARTCTDAGAAHCGWRRRKDAPAGGARCLLPLRVRRDAASCHIELFLDGALAHGRLMVGPEKNGGAEAQRCRYFSTRQQLLGHLAWLQLD